MWPFLIEPPSFVHLQHALDAPAFHKQKLYKLALTKQQKPIIHKGLAVSTSD